MNLWILQVFQALVESKSPELFAYAKYLICVLPVYYHTYNTHSLQSHELWIPAYVCCFPALFSV